MLRKKHKDVMCCIEQIPQSSILQNSSLRLLTSNHINHSRNVSKMLDTTREIKMKS